MVQAEHIALWDAVFYTMVFVVSCTFLAACTVVDHLDVICMKMYLHYSIAIVGTGCYFIVQLFHTMAEGSVLECGILKLTLNLACSQFFY